ncbi:hypothetical protein PC116_g31181 [Phytophthora cactorum]|nr:hypothetical protein PC116_g31181 [Phytophthora cactorum]
MSILVANIPPKSFVAAAHIAIAPQQVIMVGITTEGLNRFDKSMNGTFMRA